MQAAPAQDMIGVTPPRQPRSRRPRRSPATGPQRHGHASRRSTSNNHEHTPDRPGRRSRRNSAAAHTPSHHTSPAPLSTLLQPTQQQDQAAASNFPQQLQVAHARLVALQACQHPTSPVSNHTYSPVSFLLPLSQNPCHVTQLIMPRAAHQLESLSPWSPRALRFQGFLGWAA